VQLPDDEVITVVPPLVAVLVPLTMPLPAEIATPLLDETTAQLPFGPVLLPVTTVLLEPPELLTVAELLELVCATASADPKQTSTPARKRVFTMDLHVEREGGETAAQCLPRSRFPRTS
jgi:hypothetical protein